MVIVMDEAFATSEQEHLHLHTGGNESSARYIIIIIIIIIGFIHETPVMSSYLCQRHINWNEFQCNDFKYGDDTM
jgi:hypothetical protein